MTYAAWSAWGPWGDKCGLFGWIRARVRSRTGTFTQITRCARICVYQYNVPAIQCWAVSVVDAVTQTCTFAEDDYDYAFFDPPPGMPPGGTYNLDDASCDPVFSFGHMTFDWNFITVDPNVAGYSATFNGSVVNDGVPVSLGDSVGVQTAGLHVNYVGGQSEDWTFHFTTTGPATVGMLQAPPAVAPGDGTTGLLSVRNNLPIEVSLRLAISQPVGWTTMVMGDEGPVVGPGATIQVPLMIRVDDNASNGTVPLTFSVESMQQKITTFVVPVQVSTTVDVEKDAAVNSLALLPNAPNPMSTMTRIPYLLPARAQATLTIYDLGGRSVKRLFSGIQEAGLHQVSWDGTDELGHPVPSGVYVYALEVGTRKELRKLLLRR